MSVPKLYLNMIVKNESRVILRLLQSVLPLIDGYCICDTGSTDNTVELIRTFFKMANLPGIIINEPFKDFGYNRSFALKECLIAPGITQNDYILLMDADMVLTGPVLEKDKIEVFKRGLTHDVYFIMQGSNIFHYKNARIVKNKGFSYWGVTHEYLQTHKGSSYHSIDKTELFIEDIGDGGAKSDKYERDIRLLIKGLEDDPTAARYAFYLANTYRDSGNHIKAIEYYKKRIEMGGWIEEVWHSYYSLGKCYMNINDIPNEDIRKKIFYIPQKPKLFNRTLYENIVYGIEPPPSKEEVIKLMDDLNIDIKDVFIEKMDESVGVEGNSLSGGQRQIVWLIRSIYRPSAILVLDEPTSALDPENKINMISTIKKLSVGKTVIIVSHDDIDPMFRKIEMKNGHIVNSLF